MKTAFITCSWVVDSDGLQVPDIMLDYPSLSFVEYIGGNVNLPDKPDPNYVTVAIECDDTTADQIANDDAYIIETTDENGAASFLDVPESAHYQEVIDTWLSQ